MTKKDYELIAKAVRRAREISVPNEELIGIGVVAVELARVLERDNPKFKALRFLKACNSAEARGGVSGQHARP